ncbi:MAG: methylated-DNA--[protein]-cysteine S-methyltransferase, partial [Limisphaerales bacterium]
VELRFPGEQPDGLDEAADEVQEWHALTTAAVLAILDGREFGRIPPIDLSVHTRFRLKVWEQLQQIPVGETASYAEVAAAIGQPAATRAVGGACGANPIPLIIPCHRVVQMACGRRQLGGFSGGLGWKRKLLAVEGVVIEAESGQSRRF